VQVLSLIFVESSRKEDARRLALMCSFFRDITQGLPQLFRAITITTRPLRSEPPDSVFGLYFYRIRSSDHLSALLERTMETTLAISIDFPSYGTLDSKQQREATSMLSTLCRHSDRWEILEILFGWDVIDWREMLLGPLEKLRRLSLSTDSQPIMETMMHWLLQVHVPHVEPDDERQLKTPSKASRSFGIRDLTLKYGDFASIEVDSMGQLLSACHSLRSLHIWGGYADFSEVITLNSLTELTLCSEIPLSCLQTPALTHLTLDEQVWIGEDEFTLSYPPLSRLSVTSRTPQELFKRLHVPTCDVLFLNSAKSEVDDSSGSWIEDFSGIKARIVIIHHAPFPEATFISMLRTMSGTLEELELVGVGIESEFIDLFSKRDQCVQTVREFRFRNRQYQRWIWTPSVGWKFLGM